MRKLSMNSLLAFAFALTMAACGSSKSSHGVVEAKDKGTTDGPKTSSTSSSHHVPPPIPSPNPTDAKKPQAPPKPPSDPVAAKLDARQYSGSSSDYLRVYLQLKVDQEKDSVQKNQNLKLAGSIREAHLKIAYNTGDVTVSIERDGLETLVLSGSLNEQQEADLRGGTGNHLHGSLKCMDQQAANSTPTCENAIANITINGADIKLIFRRTNVDINAKFPLKNCQTAECMKLYKTFSAESDTNSINTAKMESFEVISGRSAFRLIIITNGNQVISVGGPLLSPDEHAISNTIADRTLRVEDTVDLQNMDNYKTDLQNDLSDVRIIGNDGLGKVTLQMKIARPDGGLQDQFVLEVARLQRNILSLSDDKADLSMK